MLWRRSVVFVALMTVVAGLLAAPFTHAHQARVDGDDHHRPGHSAIHSHSTPHPPDDSDHPVEPGDEGDGSEKDLTFSLNTFVFQPVPSVAATGPALVIAGLIDIELPSVWAGRQVLAPVAHGPPSVAPASLRAPPICSSASI